MSRKKEIVELLMSLSVNSMISESIFFKVLDENDVEIDLIPFIYESLINRKLEIVSDDNYVSHNDISNKNDSKVIKRQNYYLEEQIKYLNESGNLIKKKFFEDYYKTRCQSTYMPVTVLGLFDRTNEFGKVQITELITFFKNFYESRKAKGLIVERADSILAKTIPSDQKIKDLILHNPLGRSCLVKYIRYNENNEILEINENFWNSLRISDVILIKKQSEKIINDYYEKLSLKN